MKLLDRIRLTLHSAVEVAREHARVERKRTLPETVRLTNPSASTLRRLRGLGAV